MKFVMMTALVSALALGANAECSRFQKTKMKKWGEDAIRWEIKDERYSSVSNITQTDVTGEECATLVGGIISRRADRSQPYEKIAFLMKVGLAGEFTPKTESVVYFDPNSGDVLADPFEIASE